MHINTKITIVIPSYNRHQYILRSILYWCKLNVNIIIMDGSSKAIENPLVHKYNNIKYIHSNASYSERLLNSINHVNTEYVSLLGDDEFFVPSGINDCINTIQDDKFICAMGRVVLFKISNNKILAQDWIPGKTSFKNYSLNSEDNFLRLNKHMKYYLCSTIYGVFKFYNWKKCIECASIPTNIADTIELGFELASAYLGKSTVIDTLYWFRSTENEEIYSIEVKNKIAQKKMYMVFDDPDYQYEIHDFLKKMAFILAEDREDFYEVTKIKNMLYYSLQLFCKKT
jgi:glycosyltransferase domain-containing protein